MRSVHHAQWDNHSHCAPINKTFHYSSNISYSLQPLPAFKTHISPPWLYTALCRTLPYC